MFWIMAWLVGICFPNTYLVFPTISGFTGPDSLPGPFSFIPPLTKMQTFTACHFCSRRRESPGTWLQSAESSRRRVCYGPLLAVADVKYPKWPAGH